jgi:hypothetical protein
MAYFEQISINDGATLYSGTIAATGAGASISTQFYSSVTVQVTGAGYGTINIEGSNDGTNWSTIKLLPSSDVALVDSITASDEIYTFKVSTLYIRYNVQQYSGTLNLVIVGRSNTGPNAADNLTAAFDPNTPLNVKVQNKTDQFGALMLSDGIPYFMTGNNIYVFNTNGYASFTIQLSGTTPATAVAQSIDGEYYSSTPIFNISALSAQGGVNTSGAGVTSTNSAGIYVGAIYGQFLRITLSAGAGTVPGQVSIILKNAPISASYSNLGVNPTNITTIAGTAINSIGAAATVSALPISGADISGLIRRLLTDVSGRAIVTGGIPLFLTPSGVQQNTPSSSTALPHNSIGMLPHTYQLSGAMNVQDTSQFEGQTQIELLAQILLEMRIMNQQLYELPRLMATSQQSFDPPETFRQEPSIFNQ